MFCLTQTNQLFITGMLKKYLFKNEKEKKFNLNVLFYVTIF